MKKIISRIVSAASAAVTLGVQCMTPFPENLFQARAVSASALTAQAAERISGDEAGQLSAEPADSPAADILLGDVNGDGELSVADAVLLCRILAEDDIDDISLTEQNYLAADYTQDGMLTMLDLTRLLERLAGAETDPPHETDKPVLNVTLSKEKDIHEHDDIVVTVTAEDESGIKRLLCLYDGDEVQPDENGQIFLNDFDMNPHAMIFRAWDNYDNLSSKLLTFYLVETEVPGESSVSVGDGDAPDASELTAQIIMPTDGSTVSCPTYVIGNAGGTEFEKYRLEYCSASGGDDTLIEEGSTAVSGQSLGEFDPTMLQNGLYTIRLTAWSKDGTAVSDEVTVSVEGQMKIGNFSMDFQDMSLNAAGLSVALIRGYDSRDRNVSGDFGYGWNLATSGAKIETSCNLSSGWEKSGTTDAVYSAKKPHTVSVDWGNGKTERFVMKVTSNGWASHSPVSISFESTDKNGSKLTTNYDGYEWLYESGQLYLLDADWEEVYYDPQVYTLTRKDGTVYTFRKDRGLTKVQNPNGSYLDVYTNALLGNGDQENSLLYFEKDSENRITSIISSSGQSVSYAYDDNGDLVKVTDVSGYETTFVYDRHYLTEIIDPRGITVSKNYYDDNGRLIRTVDADGNAVTFDHNLDGREEIITNPGGGITRYLYDKNGNVMSVTDANGNTVTSTYDSNGYLASKTDAMGNVTRYTYDESGNLLGLTDAEGNTVTNEYDAKGFVTSVSAMGTDIIKISYDDMGNTVSTEDALGNVISYDYDGKGNLTSVTDGIGTYLNVTYDSRGNVISSTNGIGTTAEYTYDANGFCTSKTLTYTSDGSSVTVTENYTHDAEGNLVKIIGSNGRITSAEYNCIGKIASVTDEKNRQTVYDYDKRGNLSTIRYADGTSEQFTYDREGNNLTATDRLGRTVKMKYDKVGNLLSKTYPNGAAVSYSYDPNYNLVSVTGADGGETTYEYDKVNRNTAIVDALGSRTEYTYNELSQLGSMTDARGNTYIYSYDANGNRISTEFPDHSTVSSAYDARGRVTSQTDQNGYTTSYTYDGADRLTAVTDALGSTTSYTYDELGNLILVTDANHNSTAYTYDESGRVIKTTNALGKTAEVTYDVCGNILTSTDFGGKLTEYTYDENDRLIAKKTLDGTVSYTYTEDGKLASVTDPSGTAVFTYNDTDGLSKAEYPDGSYVSYEYDTAGRLTSVKTAFGTTSYEYDKLSRPVRVIDRNGYATVYEYDANGNRSAVKYANGITVTYEYDKLNRLIKETAADKNGAITAQYEYTLGAAGERTKVTETDRTVAYTYDALYRLTSETVTAGSTKTSYTYAYDAVSNRVSKTENGAGTTYTYNALNQLVSENDITYAYDDAGNLISVTSDAKSVLYTYNEENRMIRAAVQEGSEVSVEEYYYDYAGNRTAKKSGDDYTFYLNDISGGLTQVLAELDADGKEKCWYTRGAELISQERGGAVSYYLTDGHGSVRQLADAEGSITDTYVYDAWGNLTASSGTTENSYLYCGEQLDSATGLYYLRARYMDPSTGTFNTADTYQGSRFDPVSLHKYLYANANPVMYADPSGHEARSLSEMEVAVAAFTILAAAEAMYSSFALNYYRNFRSSSVAGIIETINDLTIEIEDLITKTMYMTSKAVLTKIRSYVLEHTKVKTDFVEVTAIFYVNGHVYTDVNPTARVSLQVGPLDLGFLPGVTAINKQLNLVHAEIGAMAQAFLQGERDGAGVLYVQGAPVCQYCRIDTKKMAKAMHLKSLEIIDETGTYFFDNSSGDYETSKNGGKSWSDAFFPLP